VAGTTIPESLSAKPRPSVVASATRPFISIGASVPIWRSGAPADNQAYGPPSGALTADRAGRPTSRTTSSSPPIASRVCSLPNRIRRFVSPLRTSTVHRPPSSTVSMNAPRWVRWSGGRSQSASAMPTTVTAPAARTASTRRQVSRTPAVSSARIAKPGTSAGGPPKSAPIDGAPSIATATTPTAATTATACPRRPARSSGSANATAVRIIAVANSANAGLPKP